ncbi:MAG: serine protease [Verrucomicrobiota bacterium]|nr:serine protease [Verrucomicrobiota bacterium]
MRTPVLFLIALLTLVPPAEAKKAPVAVKKMPTSAQEAVQAKEVSLVRVNVTGQPYDYFRPWQKKAPFSKRALGAVLPNDRVLVTADLVANQNYVELERAESGEKITATVVVIDYEANLALIEPTDKKFLKGLQPLELALDTVVGDRLSAWQLEATGALVVTEGIVTTIGITRYPADVADFLTYRLSIPMQYRDNSYTVPLVKKNKLAALLLRYDPRSQVLDAIPAPIIAHFLKDAAGEKYQGFPSLGISFFPTRDPQLRAYAGETTKTGGVYITSVEPGLPAAKAGLQPGDIVTAVEDHDIDQNGNYVDPLYGKLGFSNLLTAKAYVGDSVALHVMRSGKALTLKVKLEHRAEEDYVVPPYNIDDPPSYYVLGGLIFQELTRQYLKEWGNNWEKEAPQDFVYLDKYQSELYPEGKRRVVILSQVLPANSTIGYDDFSYLVVKKVNDKEIHSLADLAEAVKTPLNGFNVIQTVDDPKQLALDAAQVAAEADAVQKNYGLPALQRLE